MANIDENFVVKTGLTVGPTVITAATGNIQVGGTVINGATGDIAVGSTVINGTTGAITTSANVTTTANFIVGTTVLNPSGSVSTSNIVATGGTINNVIIGGSTPTTATFTTVNASSVVGPLTGNVTGTILTAMQNNITHVGTLTDLTVSGTATANVFNGPLTGNVTGNASSATTAGTVTAAAQPTITSVGTLTSLGVAGTVTAGSFSGPLIGSVTGSVTGSVIGNVTGTSSSATNISGGAAGSLPYQTATNSTSLLAKGTDGQVLTLVSGLPSWSSTPAFAANALIGTTLATNVVNSSLTSVGTLSGLTSSGAVNITNATSSTSASTGALLVTGGVGIGGNVNISGNLNVAGSMTTVNSNVTVLSSSMLYLADGQPTDVLDIGVYGNFNSSTTDTHTGIVRDASDGIWKFFSGVTAEPGTTVDFTSATYSPVKMGALTATTGSFTGNVVSSGSANTGFVVGSNTVFYSALFNGSTDVVSSPANAAFAVGNVNWTMEAWIRPTSYASVGAVMGIVGSGGNSDYIMYVNGSGKLVGSTSANGLYTSTATIPLNQWTHVAIVATSAGNTKTFINGTQDAGVGNTTFSITSNQAKVGGTGTYFFPGYISNARFSNTAVYTTTFTPSTTSLTSTANTLLLTANAATLVDASSNNWTLTVSGSPAVSSSVTPFGSGGSGQAFLLNDGSGNWKTSSTITASGFTGAHTGSGAGLTSIPNTSLVNSSITVSPGTGMSGGGAVSLGGNITLTNTGVTSLTNGGHITASAGTGSVTLGSDATNINTASTIVSRDASGNFAAGTITAALTGTASKATNVAGGAAWQVHYQSAADTTAFVSAGTTGQILTATTGGAPTWATRTTVDSLATSGVGISVNAASGAVTLTSNATALNTASTIVSRDASGNFAAGVITATSTNARYADLAENYSADAVYAPGTVVEFGGDAEVTLGSDSSRKVAGVVTTNPAYLMNVDLAGVKAAVALQGRVPCKVKGKVSKGDMMVSAGGGYARAEADPKLGQVIGKALDSFDGAEGVIEVVVGRM